MFHGSNAKEDNNLEQAVLRNEIDIGSYLDKDYHRSSELHFTYPVTHYGQVYLTKNKIK